MRIVKELTAELYSAKLAPERFIALAFDTSFQGKSDGEPRYLEDAATRVENIPCAVDYLNLLDFVNEERIGLPDNLAPLQNLQWSARRIFCGNGGLTEIEFFP